MKMRWCALWCDIKFNFDFYFLKKLWQVLNFPTFSPSPPYIVCVVLYLNQPKFPSTRCSGFQTIKIQPFPSTPSVITPDLTEDDDSSWAWFSAWSPLGSSCWKEQVICCQESNQNREVWEEIAEILGTAQLRACSHCYYKGKFAGECVWVLVVGWC